MKAILLNRLLIILGFAGLAIAGYLTMAHWMGAEMACIIGSGCGKIANSPYSWLPFGSQGTNSFGVPVAFPGFLAYATLTALALVRCMRGDPSRMLSKIGAAVSGVGFLISAVLMYVAFSVIQATCTWCVLSAVTMALTFILHMVMLNGEPLEKHWNNIFITPVAALAFGVLGWQAVMLTPRINKTGPTTTELTPENPKLFGTIGAPLVVIEFADLTCPHCRESYAEFKRMIKDEGATFEIVWRSFPLRNMPGHEMGLPAAAIGELVAEKGKFFQYVDMVVAVDVKELSVPRLLSMAESLGVDPEVAKKRIADDKDPAFLRLKADIAAGDKLGILQTPTYYVGERGKVTYPAKQNNFAMVMDQPDIRSFWDKKVKR